MVGAGTLCDVLPDRTEPDANLKRVTILDPGAVDQRQQIGVVGVPPAPTVTVLPDNDSP